MNLFGTLTYVERSETVFANRSTQSGDTRLTDDERISSLYLEHPICRQLIGNLSKTEGLTGDLSVPERSGGVPYEGDYEITPGEEPIVLNTTGKVMLQDLTIEPIPTDYGKVTWTSGHLFIS